MPSFHRKNHYGVGLIIAVQASILIVTGAGHRPDRPQLNMGSIWDALNDSICRINSDRGGNDPTLLKRSNYNKVMEKYRTGSNQHH